MVVSQYEAGIFIKKSEEMLSLFVMFLVVVLILKFIFKLQFPTDVLLVIRY